MGGLKLHKNEKKLGGLADFFQAAQVADVSSCMAVAQRPGPRASGRRRRQGEIFGAPFQKKL